jgi:hypothetical protein
MERHCNNSFLAKLVNFVTPDNVPSLQAVAESIILVLQNRKEEKNQGEVHVKDSRNGSCIYNEPSTHYSLQKNL